MGAFRRLDTDLTTVSGRLHGLRPHRRTCVLVGPFIEELVFRGVVLSALGQLWAYGSILISSAIFATYHFSLWMLVPTFVLGVALDGSPRRPKDSGRR